MSRIALFGGSFDPIHLGHLISARTIAEARNLDRVIFLPGHSLPHKLNLKLADPAHRAEMVKLAIADDPLFEFNDADLRASGPCYTYDTVIHFRDMLGPSTEIAWIIGADSLPDLPTWRRAAELIDACTILTACRPGCDQPDWNVLAAALGKLRVQKLQAGIIETPRIDISSTQIRERRSKNLSIRYLVSEPVLEYIQVHNLYRVP